MQGLFFSNKLNGVRVRGKKVEGQEIQEVILFLLKLISGFI